MRTQYASAVGGRFPAATVPQGTHFGFVYTNANPVGVSPQTLHFFGRRLETVRSQKRFSGRADAHARSHRHATRGGTDTEGGPSCLLG